MLFSTLIGLLAVVLNVSSGIATTGPVTILPAQRVGGASGFGDARDVDIYPAVAADATTGLQLVVWMTARNAQSSSDGFDVYGILTTGAGQPIGSEFRISASNTAARGDPPVVAAGNGDFTVAWSVQGSPCQIVVQEVTDSGTLLGSNALTVASGHSPALAFDSIAQRYVLAYSTGDDYLPPTFEGAQTADCGNNPTSVSEIDATEFSMANGNPVVDKTVSVSDPGVGAFRPRLAYDPSSDQYLVAWEDRRNAAGQPYYFDVYSQLLRGDLSAVGSNARMTAGADYSDLDNSSTWTPRPVVAAGGANFLVAWFTASSQGGGTIWTVTGRLVSFSGVPSAPFSIVGMVFASSHPGQAPTGFLAARYAADTDEYFVALTTQLESILGYISSVRIQRITSAGQLLHLDGSAKSQLDSGDFVHASTDDQFSVAVASSPGVVSLVYGEHASTSAAEDYDIWGTIIQTQSPIVNLSHHIYLPSVSRISLAG